MRKRTRGAFQLASPRFSKSIFTRVRKALRGL